MTREEQTQREAARFTADIEDWEVSEDLQDAFIQGAEWADEHPHWISVEEELPQEDENVLVSINGSVFYGCWLGGEMWAIARQPLEEKINGNVTHWMPLPAAPKKGGEG